MILTEKEYDTQNNDFQKSSSK